MAMILSKRAYPSKYLEDVDPGETPNIRKI